MSDQLSKDISSLNGCIKSEDTILICEVLNEATYVKHHKKKIAFLFSARRHFSMELQESGYRVSYIKLEDNQNSGSQISANNYYFDNNYHILQRVSAILLDASSFYLLWWHLQKILLVVSK